jgi:hypothetical protein
MAFNRNPGPFLESFFIPDARIERLAQEKLVSLGLMPQSPGPVPIERYCDKRWGLPEDYVDLPAGVMGRAVFSEAGLDRIEISRELSEDSSSIGIIRTRSTLIHEIGHGELHAEKFAEKIRHDNRHGDLFGQVLPAQEKMDILCREEQMRRPGRDEWWEVQANKFMAAALMPKHLLRQVIDEWRSKKPSFWPLEIVVSDTFNVSQQMAGIATNSMLEAILRESQQLDTKAIKNR